MIRSDISSKPSKAKRDFDAEYAAVLPSVLARGCEFAAHALPSNPNLNVVQPWNWQCGGRLVGHHAKGRRAVDANDHVICLCSEHHIFVHANSRWARQVGLMLSRIS